MSIPEGMIKKILLQTSLALGICACSPAGDVQDVFALLDLDRPGLEEVKARCGSGQ